MSIAIVSMPVADQIRSRDFYRDVAGFTVLRDEPMGEARWIQLQPKDGGATIALVGWFDKLQPGGQQGLMVGIDDIDAEHARLSSLGLKVSPVQEEPWGRFTMFEDPDGNGLIFAQLTQPQEIKTR